MTEVTSEPAAYAHIEEFAPLMRKEDVRECEAMEYPSPSAALASSLVASFWARTVRFNGEIAAMLGLVEMPSPVVGERLCCAWCLTGRAVDVFPMTFFRLSRQVLVDLLEHADVLVNLVPARYQAALRWLKSLGFTIGEPRPFGPKDLLFHVVAIRR